MEKTLPADSSDNLKNNGSGKYVRSRFRFKSKRARDEDTADRPSSSNDKRRRREDVDYQNNSPINSPLQERHARRHHRRSKRKTEPDDNVQSNTSTTSARNTDPEVAFREALFDAMADDEGAAYWEGVYDQPIHVYPNTKLGPEGELEQMSDEEYTAYVRARMYEKTHQHILEERARREEMHERQRSSRRNTKRMEADRQAFQSRVEESLRRGEERKVEKQWKEAWSSYAKNWERLKAKSTSSANGESEKSEATRVDIPWPVKSRRMSDISKDEVEKFFHHATQDEGGAPGLAAMLKMERVRWHPDKMQQRLGRQNVDKISMQAITAVFQVIDRMWTDLKSKNSAS